LACCAVRSLAGVLCLNQYRIYVMGKRLLHPNGGSLAKLR
jgi:hypothetical protein